MDRNAARGARKTRSGGEPPAGARVARGAEGAAPICATARRVGAGRAASAACPVAAPDPRQRRRPAAGNTLLIH